MPCTLNFASAQSLLIEYLRGDMESIYPELALCGSKNECARTDTVFFTISEVSEGTVSLARKKVWTEAQQGLIQ